MRGFLSPSQLMLCLVLGMSGAGWTGRAQDAQEIPDGALPDSSGFNSPVGHALPNVELPGGVPAEPGKLTFYADFKAKGPDGVPLYVVNRTAEAVSLPAQDGDLYVRLEYKNKEGEWVRAQPCARSDCGMSYSPVTLPPGNFFAFRGKMPKEGVKARVRFASFRNKALVSKEVEGFYSPEELSATQNDEYSRVIPHALARYLREPWDWSGATLYSPEEAVAALRLVQVQGANPYYQQAAEVMAKALEKKPDASATDQKAVASIRKILAEPWPAKRDPLALRDRCLRALSAPKTRSGEFGNPDDFPLMMWEILLSGEALNNPANPAEWKPVVDLVLKDGRPELLCELAQNEPVADEFLPDEFFEKHLFDENSPRQAFCAAALSRRGRWEQLAELGWKLSPDGQVAALRALAYPKASSGSFFLSQGRRPLAGNEEKFWRYCLSSQPIPAAAALYSLRSGRNDEIDGMIHAPLREALLAEVKKSGQQQEDFWLKDPYSMPLAVSYLGECSQKEDNEVLQALLDYRGYEKEEGTKSNGGPFRPYVAHRFGVRAAAKSQLEKRGIPVREDLVVEEEVAPQKP